MKDELTVALEHLSDIAIAHQQDASHNAKRAREMLVFYQSMGSEVHLNKYKWHQNRAELYYYKARGLMLIILQHANVG